MYIDFSNTQVTPKKKSMDLKSYARKKVEHQIRYGRWERPTICMHCGLSSDRIEAHHEDYTKPLSVVWLCKKCHTQADKLVNKNIIKYSPTGKNTLREAATVEV